MTETKTALCLAPGIPGSGLQTRIAPVEISYFSRPISNLIPSRSMSVWDAYLHITQHNQYQTSVLRKIADPRLARDYKARMFNSVTFSGVFATRCDADLIHHSGLLTLDFDHISDLQKLKAALLSDSYFETVLLFYSPSGDGLKWIVGIDTEEHSHLQWFNAIAAYIKATYHLEIDCSGRNVSRCCFLPFDNEAYINPGYIQ